MTDKKNDKIEEWVGSMADMEKRITFIEKTVLKAVMAGE